MSGNSVISFLLGTGCSVPGIMATRTIKQERERKITAITTSWIPCSAKLPIISLFVTYFFPEHRAWITVSFYAVALLLIIATGMWYQKGKGKLDSGYFAELPEYRLPRGKQILRDSWERVWEFMKRAGSLIFLSSIVIWFLLSFSVRLEAGKFHVAYGVAIEESLLAKIGSAISWLFVPMVGENRWEIGVATIQGLVAKEQVVSSMAIMAGLEADTVMGNLFVEGSPFAFFTPLSAYAFVCFHLFTIPCVSAVGAMKKALGNQQTLRKAVICQIGLAYGISCMIYQVGSLWMGR